MAKQNKGSIQVTGSALETREQRANHQRALVQEINSGVAAERVARHYSNRLRDRYARAMAANIESKCRWVTYGKRGCKASEVQDFVMLTERYGAPTPDAVHIDRLLSNVLADSPQGEFIADLALPMLSVPKRSDTIQMLSRRAGKSRASDDVRAPGSKAASMGWELGDRVSFRVENHELTLPIPDETRESQDEPIKVEGLSARYVRESVLIRREGRVATLLQTATNFAAANRIGAPGVPWDNADTSDNEHLTDIHAGHEAVRSAIGKRANLAILTWPVVLALIKKDDYRDRFKYVKQTTDDSLIAELASYLLVEDVLIPTSMEDTANAGQTAVYADIWADDVTLLYQEEPNTIGYRGFGFSPATDMGTASSWRDPEPTTKSDIVHFGNALDEIVVNNAAGAHLDNVLT